MRSTLDEMLSALDDLDDFARSIGPVNDSLAEHVEAVIKRYLVLRRQFDYCAFVVALYAAFERFVEDLAWAYAETISKNTKYLDLPEKLRGKHVRESGELLARARLGEGRYLDVTETEVVGKLHGCLSGREPYRLNKHALVQHELNLRASVVQQVFACVGIDEVNDAARRSDPLVRWFTETTGTEPDDEAVHPSTIELRLKDLVQRRNEVSHSGREVAQSLGTTEMQERLQFVRAYCQSLFAAVAGAYLDRTYLKGPSASEPLCVSEGPFQDHTIVVVNKPPCRVFVGQPVFGVRNRRVDRWGNIQEIKLDGADATSVESDSTATSVGLKLDFKVTKHTQLHLLTQVDDVIWR